MSNVTLCEGCKSPSCYIKKDGKLEPRPCYVKKYVRRVYSDLLTGPRPVKDVYDAAMKAKIQPNSFVFMPYRQGATRVAALLLLRLQVSIFRTMHTHSLVDVYVNNAEDDKSIKEMYSPFFLMLHGFINTPNRRLNDLICEFMSYRISEGVPFMIFSILRPDPQIVNFLKENSLTSLELRTAKDKEERVF